MKDLAVKIVPKKAVEDDDIPNDIKQLGELTQSMLKNYTTDSVETCNASTD